MQTRKSKRNITNKSQRQQNSETGDQLLNDYYPIKVLKQSLAQRYASNALLCRNNQKQQINKFLYECTLNKIQSKVLYISGVPGVGKTTTSQQVVTNFIKQTKNMQYQYVNAMNLKRPEDIYEIILRKIFKTRKFQGKIIKKYILTQLSYQIQNIQKNILFLIDQVDYLMTKDQTVFYNLFQWASTSSTKFFLIIIGNTIDFPERLTSKVVSRLGKHRLTFKPYSSTQLIEIVKNRIKGSKLFNQRAINYFCKKMSTFTSDIRKIFNIISQAQLSSQGKQIPIQKIIQLLKINLGINQIIQDKLPTFFINILNVIKDKNGKVDHLEIYQLLRPNYSYQQKDILYGLKQLQSIGLIVLQSIVKKGLRKEIATLIR